jgi:hypothetical protein
MKSIRSAIALFFLTALAALAGPVNIAWNDPGPGTPVVEGYNFYQVVKVPAADPLPETITYVKNNVEPIPAGSRQYTIPDAADGSTWTLRAFNVAGESPDSEWLTIVGGPPAAPTGVKQIALIVESSPDMLKWGAHAVLQIAAVPPQQFFRLRW